MCVLSKHRQLYTWRYVVAVFRRYWLSKYVYNVLGYVFFLGQLEANNYPVTNEREMTRRLSKPCQLIISTCLFYCWAYSLKQQSVLQKSALYFVLISIDEIYRCCSIVRADYTDLGSSFSLDNSNANIDNRIFIRV